MSVEWLSNYFDFDTMSPADMILSRHMEVLRDFDDGVSPTIPEALGGEEERLIYCPLGTELSSIVHPVIFCTAGSCEYNPEPTVKAHVLIVRDVIRFEQWKPADIGEPWTPSLNSLVHLMRRAADSNPHLNFEPEGWDGEPLPLARHLVTRPIDLQNLLNPDGTLSAVWDCVVEFEYRTEVSRETGRIWSLSVNSL